MNTRWMRRAIALAVDNVTSERGAPFGALVVQHGDVVAEATNRVHATDDPTAHAEVMAIRKACSTLGRSDLGGCTLYTSCEPCPMCAAAVYWARLDRVYYAVSHARAGTVGFDDALIKEQLQQAPAERTIPMEQELADEGWEAFQTWAALQD